MKKLLSFLLVLLMVFVLLPNQSARADGPNEIYVHNYTELQEALQNYS